MPRVKRSESLLSSVEQKTSDFLMAESLSPASLCGAGAERIVQLQGELLMGSTWGEWEVSGNLIAAHNVSNSRRTFRIDLAIPHGFDPDSPEARQVWLELMRFAVARRAFALSGSGTSGRPWFSTIHTEIRSLANATKQLILRPGPGFWSRCSNDEFCLWVGGRDRVFLNTVRKLHSLGAIADSPSGRRKPLGAGPSRDRTGEPEHRREVVSDQQYRPLPDAFTAAAGQRALFLVEDVGPTLLDALEHCSSIDLRTINLDPRSASFGCELGLRHKYEVAASQLDPVIAGWGWKDGAGRPLNHLRFDFGFSQPGRGRFRWPPRTHAQAESILSAIQNSHLFLIALADGGRHGELLSLREGAVRRADSPEPTLASITRKLDPNGGRVREVPIPAAVQFAVQQQERLARHLKDSYGVAGDHLWVRTGNLRGLPLLDFGRQLRSFPAFLGVKSLLDDKNLHMHRFRKTLARICALALVHAPKILMDVLGHRDEQMTVMRYILSDPGLLKEVEEITRELLVLKGVWAIENMDSIQGRGAQNLRERWKQHAALVGKSALEPQNIREFIEVAFENGQALAVIAPGILCTSFTKGGRCNAHGGGAPNPEHCSPQCDYQVTANVSGFSNDCTENDAVQLALDTANYILDQLQSATSRGEEMVVATLSGQLRSLLGRWSQVDRFVSSHPFGSRIIPSRLSI